MIRVFRYILPPKHLHQVIYLLFTHLHPFRVTFFPCRSNHHITLTPSLYPQRLPCSDKTDSSKERGTVLPVLVMEREQITEEGTEGNKEGTIEWDTLFGTKGVVNQEGEHDIRAIDGQVVHCCNAL